ncbi:DsbA family protein [Methylobacterium sp. WSM2598]|uniref:DsbA family protein n=1 Tax=Methylobacterium sp. WSM2598 TaxID=398261 RepID=UPI00036E9DF7|nr:DsbA family protein [Methylobacterium sp. WSM2598]
MRLSRRSFLAALAASAAPARAQEDPAGEGQWYPLTGDDGRPVANRRLPGELVSEIEALPGIVLAGSATPDITLYEFFDFNCPWCRAASRDLDSLLRARPTLRIGLVQNPILSPRSAQAAKVALALQRRAGPAASFALYRDLLGRPGAIDGPASLDAARALGHDRAALAEEADSTLVGRALATQMRLAADLGLSATPSYVVGTTALLGHPGGRTLARILASVETCDTVVCNTESPG